MSLVVIAVRGGIGAKTRLAPVLSADERAHLVAAMVSAMLAAIGAARCLVVTPTPALVALARAAGARALVQTNGPGLDEAFALARAAERGPIVFLPGDLPMARAAEVDRLFAALSDHPVALAPAPADGGTGAIALAAGIDFATRFGPDSFARHLGIARSRKLPVARWSLPGLGWDIDRPADLETLIATAQPPRPLADWIGRAPAAACKVPA